MSNVIDNNAVFLFQGDSITDGGRERNNPCDLGVGYVMMVASWFSALYPEKKVQFLNRGIGGNRVRDLVERWQVDTIDLKPAWVSILIGINDVWRRFDRNDPLSVEEYESMYTYILDQVKTKLNARIVILEPFLLPVKKEQEEWRDDLDSKIKVTRRLAHKFTAYYVPLDGLFAAAGVKREPTFWTKDGVHPTQPGNALIAQAWLRAVIGRQ